MDAEWVSRTVASGKPRSPVGGLVLVGGNETVHAERGVPNQRIAVRPDGLLYRLRGHPVGEPHRLQDTAQLRVPTGTARHQSLYTASVLVTMQVTVHTRVHVSEHSRSWPRLWSASAVTASVVTMTCKDKVPHCVLFLVSFNSQGMSNCILLLLSVLFQGMSNCVLSSSLPSFRELSTVYCSSSLSSFRGLGTVSCSSFLFSFWG